MLVFSSDLEQVEEVGRGGVDGDQILRGFGVGSGQVEDLEVFWALELLV